MSSMLDLIRPHVEDTPDAVAIRHDNSAVNYAELYAASLAMSAEIRGLGVVENDRVVLIAPSVPEFASAYFAIQAAGGVVVPMNTMSTANEIGYVLDDCTPSLVVVWGGLEEAAETAANEREIEVKILRPGLTATTGTPAAVVQRSPEDTVQILYTSGTTGRPKGVEITLSNLLTASDAAARLWGVTAADRCGTGLPLFHVFGQVPVLFAFLSRGASVSLLSRFDPKALLEMFVRDEVTLIAGVPTMWNAANAALKSMEELDFSTIRLAVSGGASLPAEVLHQFEARFGCRLVEGYGMTEMTALGAFTDLGGEPKPGSVGRPMDDVRLELRDRDGKPVPDGEVGEIFLAGPTVMKGYWNRPEETAAAIVDGWLRTGDLGRIDGGDLYIVDRLKDMIIRGGYNVYPAEIEQVLYGHPDIIEAAVIGVPDQHLGQEIAALVALTPGSGLTAEALTDWCRGQLSGYKVPRIVRFVESLPKGPTGKILKRAIDLEVVG